MCKRILALLLALMLCASLQPAAASRRKKPSRADMNWTNTTAGGNTTTIPPSSPLRTETPGRSTRATAAFPTQGCLNSTAGASARWTSRAKPRTISCWTKTGTLLTDDDGDTLRPTQAPSAAKSRSDEEDVTLADYVGVWEYDTAYAWLAIDGDGNWMTVDGNGEIARNRHGGGSQRGRSEPVSPFRGGLLDLYANQRDGNQRGFLRRIALCGGRNCPSRRRRPRRTRL